MPFIMPLIVFISSFFIIIRFSTIIFHHLVWTSLMKTIIKCFIEPGFLLAFHCFPVHYGFFRYYFILPSGFRFGCLLVSLRLTVRIGSTLHWQYQPECTGPLSFFFITRLFRQQNFINCSLFSYYHSTSLQWIILLRTIVFLLHSSLYLW